MPWLGTSGRTCSLSGGATWARPKEALYCRSSRWSRGAGTFCGGPGRPLWYEVSSHGPWSSEKHLGARRLCWPECPRSGSWWRIGHLARDLAARAALGRVLVLFDADENLRGAVGYSGNPWGHFHVRAAVLTAACLTAGCYSYSPLATPDPEPGTSIEATLTDQGSRDLAPALGPDVLLVRGRYQGTDEGGLRLAVAAVETKRGIVNSWANEPVTIATTAIASVSIRRLSTGRSLLLAGVGVAGVAAVTLGFSVTGSGSPPGVHPPPPPPR